MKPQVGIFGGSFNPPHLGHMRLAVEMLEAMRPARLDFLLSARPPHKGGRPILPFELRASLLRAATAGMDRVAVNLMESEREGPSYTVDTLNLYRQREPDHRFFFILGAEDFAVINTWHEWRKLPYLADLVVVPRSGMEVEVFTNTVRTCWPEALPVASPVPAANAAYALPQDQGGGLLLHLPLPRLDIRAELIRERLLNGRSARFLVPDAIYELLTGDPEIVECWKS